MLTPNCTSGKDVVILNNMPCYIFSGFPFTLFTRLVLLIYNYRILVLLIYKYSILVLLIYNYNILVLLIYKYSIHVLLIYNYNILVLIFFNLAPFSNIFTGT